MDPIRFRRRRFLTAAGAAFVGMPAFVPRARAQGLVKVSYQPGWIAQAEQGGFYQALATDAYRDAGLEVEIRKGGPQINVNSVFLAGNVDFAEVDGFRVLTFVKEALPAVAVAAFFQRDPRVLVSHPGVGNDTLAALKGKPILVATSGRQGYWQWLKARFGYTDEQIRPYTFNIAPFVADKQMSMQSLVTTEPFASRKAGVDPVIHVLADAGFNNYQTVVVAAPKMIKERPEVVQRFVQASAKGWQSYLNGDPAPGNALIKKINPDIGDDTIANSIAQLKKYAIVETADTRTLGLGSMSAARWQRFSDEMVAAGAQPPGLDIRQGYTLQFVNAKRS